MSRLWTLIVSYLRPARGPTARPHNAELHQIAARQMAVKAALNQEDPDTAAEAERRAYIETLARVRGRRANDHP